MAITRLEVPTLEALRNQITEDTRRMLVRAGVPRPNVAPGSERYIRAESVASVALQIMAREFALQDANMPDKATGDDLKRLASTWRGISPSLGAGAQGNVIADCTGVVTYPIGSQLTASDGLRYQVVSTTIASSGNLIPVRGIDVGKRTEKAAGTVLTWTSPPLGSALTAVVDPSGLTNGADADNDARLRARFLSSLRHPGASGSWAHYVQWAEESSGAVEKAYCYPAPRGPATVRVAFTVAATADNYYSREANASLINTVAIGVVANSPEHADVLTTTVADEDVDVVIRVMCPANKADGGVGGTWVDPLSIRWPNYYTAGSKYATYIRSVTSPTTMQVDVLNASNAPDLTGTKHPHIAIWSANKKKFVHAQVESATLSAGTIYNITLYAPIDTTAIVGGEYVSPDLEKLDDYGAKIAESFASLGPGQLTTDVDLLPRSTRRPIPEEEWPDSYTSAHIGQLSTAFPEIRHASVSLPTSMPVLPTTATLVTDPPNVLRIGNFAMYSV